MGKIFVRERAHVGEGAGRPRFAIVATQGTDLQLYQMHVRRKELEALAAAAGVEIVYLPGAERAGEEECGRRGGRRQRTQAE